MTEKNDIKRMIGPFMRVLPLITPLLIVIAVVTYRLCRYITPLYDTELRIKLDNKDDSFSRNNLYKDFDVLTASDKVLTEVQVLKSDLIITKTLEAMKIPVNYYRVGNMMDTEIYPVSPFLVIENPLKPIKKDKLYGVKLFKNGSVELCDGENCALSQIGDWTNFAGGRIKVVKNIKWIMKRGDKDMYGEFKFKMNTLQDLKSTFVGENLLVKVIDKDIDIIVIHFTSENPYKAADFVNQLASTFTKDYVETKVMAANLTSQFIDDQLGDVKERLSDAESKLETYRYQKKILNSKQELEIGLKKISQLDLQLANLQLKKITMDSLMVYVENESGDYRKYAPSFESYGGLLFVELMKKYQALIDKRRQLSAEYTQSSNEIEEVNEKLSLTKGYIKSSIFNHRELVNYQYKLLENRVKKEKEIFNDLPTKERKFLVYEREFRHNESIYNFLTKKKMEADIAKSVDLSFHKIIQKARIPKMPTSPNKVFFTALVILSVFLVLVFFTYMFNYFDSRIKSKQEVEKFFNQKICTFLVNDSTQEYQWNQDMMTDVLHVGKKEHQIFAIASPHKKEGKSYIAKAILKTQKQYFTGKTAVISNKEEGFFKDNTHLSSEVLKGWRENNFDRSYLLETYDHVLIDTTGVKFSKEEGTVLNHVDHVFFVIRYKYTNQQHLEFIERFLETNAIKSYSFIMNKYHPFADYLGDVSIANKYKKASKGIIGKLLFIKNWYNALWST